MQDKVKMKKNSTAIARLLEIIVSMNEKQQAALLRHAEELVKIDRRNLVRKSCHLQVDFAASERTHKGYIKNMSQNGLFIEAQAPVLIGEEVLMVFKLRRNSEATKLKGEIAHATRWGIGVEFTEKGPQLDEKIRDIIQRI